MELGRTNILVDLRCNNACLFCDQGSTEKEQVALQEALDHVQVVANEGVDAVTFCGGEVTLNLEGLEELVRAARSHGIDDIGIHTNGRRLAYANVTQRLIQAGVGRFEVSLHGVEEATHDWLTRTPGAFAQTLRGMRQVQKAGAELIPHMVIVRSNFRQARDMVLLAAKLRARDLHFRFVVPEGWAGAEDRLPSLVPRYTLIQPELAEAKLVAKRVGVEIHLHDFPDCVAGTMSADIVRARARWLGVDADRWPRVSNTYEKSCESCTIRERCVGFSKAYLEYYGSHEFIPILSGLITEGDSSTTVQAT